MILPLLERFYKSHRPVLFTLVDALDLQAVSAEHGVLDAVEFIRADRDRRGEWIEESTACLRDGSPVTIAVDIDSFASEQCRCPDRAGFEGAGATIGQVTPWHLSLVFRSHLIYKRPAPASSRRRCSSARSACWPTSTGSSEAGAGRNNLKGRADGAALQPIRVVGSTA